MAKLHPGPSPLVKLRVPPGPTEIADQLLSNLKLRLDEFITVGINIDKAFTKRDEENKEQLISNLTAHENDQQPEILANKLLELLQTEKEAEEESKRANLEVTQKTTKLRLESLQKWEAMGKQGTDAVDRWQRAHAMIEGRLAKHEATDDAMAKIVDDLGVHFVADEDDAQNENHLAIGLRNIVSHNMKLTGVLHMLEFNSGNWTCAEFTKAEPTFPEVKEFLREVNKSKDVIYALCLARKYWQTLFTAPTISKTVEVFDRSNNNLNYSSSNSESGGRSIMLFDDSRISE